MLKYVCLVHIKPIILSYNIGIFKQFDLIPPQQTHHFVSFNYQTNFFFCMILLFSTSSWLLKSLVLVFSACKVVMEIKKTVNL